MIAIRAYDAGQDLDATFELWRRSLGRRWPVARADFAGRLRTGLVAARGGRLAGVALHARAGDAASLQLLLVEPELERGGIGGQLHEAFLAGLAGRGVARVRLGGTPGPYLWPGVPAGLTAARRAFAAWGWAFDETCWDLTRSLADYRTPVDVRAPDHPGIACRWTTPADRNAIVAFERAHFPQWADSFAADPAAVFVAVEADGSIVGSLIATDGSRPHLWRHLLGEATGSINAVGVAEHGRGLGIGTFLVASACAALHNRGVDMCHIGWTSLLGFYGRLGFRPWRRYELASRRV